MRHYPVEAHAPRVKITDPARASIAIDACLGVWTKLRDYAHRSGCKLVEKRIGLITKRFTVTGDETALNGFIGRVWHDEYLGPELRRTVIGHA